MFMKTPIKRQADKKKRAGSHRRRAGHHTKMAQRGALLFCHKWNTTVCTYYTPGVYSDCHVRPSHLFLQDDKKREQFYAAFSNFNILLGRLFFCFKVSNFTVKLIKENCLKKNQLIKFVNELCSKLFLIRGNFCELVRAGKPT